ncbi:MAG: hypothetical protein KIPDCIKN_02871 [Haliscomenobacter sp.]|nr:hypothetical protein [Haliscomenobacter sp.]
MNKPLFLVICLAAINVFFSCNKEKEGKNAPGYRYDYVLAADKIETKPFCSASILTLISTNFPEIKMTRPRTIALLKITNSPKL